MEAKYSILARLGHYTAGLITALSIHISPFFPFLLFLVFILYEIWESLRIHDTGYLELSEYGIGLYTGVAILLVVYTL